MPQATRNLVIVLGDQLATDLSALDGFDAERDRVWMAENTEQATHVWCHKRRLVLFFSAMRHFRDRLRALGYTVDYHALTDDPANDDGPDFATLLNAAIETHSPERIVRTECGDYRVGEQLSNCAHRANLPMDVRVDQHFYCSLDDFETWLDNRKRVVLEDFYRHMRRAHDVLLDNGEPVGGAWNFDRDNRETFGRDGPGNLVHPPRFQPDAVTKTVSAMVEQRFKDHPGSAAHFDLPVTAEQADTALEDFIEHRLPEFGAYQDALWIGVRFAYHSRLSAALNLHLIGPGRCVALAVNAYRDGKAPIASVEGFVRQILGWREFVRGIYWHHMPAYIERNALGADLPVPASFWTGQTSMRCIADAMQNVLDNGYAHHIQRLMVLGLFALVAGVHPRAFHDWHMAMYLDAIDWASLPNALGMSQFGDGGVLGTKPYCASGNYINKMSNYCKNCTFNHKLATGDNACPITTLYWDFLDRNLDQFADNPRMAFQVKNLERKRDDTALMREIRAHAADLRHRIAQQTPI